PFYVNTELSAWTSPEGPRRAGGSSFGIGGTNCHVVLEQASEQESSASSSRSSGVPRLLVLSAKTDSALGATATNLAEHLERHTSTDLAEVAFTLATGRRRFPHRRICVAHTASEAADVLRRGERSRAVMRMVESDTAEVAFLFPGQGAQSSHMGLELYRTERLFREVVDDCCEHLTPRLGLDLRELLYGNGSASTSAQDRLTQTLISQPALFVVEYALAKLVLSWGIRPVAMLGHSVGEYVAACLSGVLETEDALALLVERGRLMQAIPPGAMLAVRLPEAEARDLAHDGVSLAAINAPSLSVLAGPEESIRTIEATLKEAGVAGRRLRTSHAFHSWMMDPVVDRFRDVVARVTLHPPKIPFVSNVTGTWITPQQAMDPEYWAQHL